MKKIITALFAIFIVTFTTSLTVKAYNSDSLDKVQEICQLIDSSYYYVDDGSDDPLLYRIQKQQQAMSSTDKSEKTFNPWDYTKELLNEGAKVKANIDQSPSGKNFVILEVYMEDCESSNFYSKKSFYGDGVEFTVIGKSISWRIELPF